MERVSDSGRLAGPLRVRCARRVAMGVLWLIGAAPAPAFAQRAGQIAEEGSMLLCWAVAAGLGFIVCATAFLNPKRSHRD